MKSSELKFLLERAVAFRAPEDPIERTVWVPGFFSLLDEFDGLSVGKLAKALESAASASGSCEAGVRELCTFLKSLCTLLAGYLKEASINEVRELAASLERHSESNFDLIGASLRSPKKVKKVSKPKVTKTKEVAPIRDDIVLKYLRRLEEALGDETGFHAIFTALEADTDLTSVELITIAKKFTNAAATSRKAALKKILGRQQAIMVSRAKSAATAGRIAG